MIGGRPLRHDARGFSAFYGAFAVLLAAALVFGAIAARAPFDDPSIDPRLDRTVDRFLDTLLAATPSETDESLAATLTHMCSAGPCGGAPSPQTVLAWTSALAANLSAPMGLQFLLVLSLGEGPELRSGTVEPRPGLPMSRAEVYHPGLGGFVSLTLFLGSA